MILYLTVPHTGAYAPEVHAFADAARSLLRARGNAALIFEPVRDRPTMSARNRQVHRFRATPADVFMSIDGDALPTDDDGRPDMHGFSYLLDDIVRDDIDAVFVPYMILLEASRQLVPGVTSPKTDPGAPEYPIDFASMYAKDGPVEITGGGAGTHAFMVKRHVFESMLAKGRIWFEDLFHRDPASPDFGCRRHGHDLMFCRNMADFGFRYWLENRVHWGHRKDIDLRWFHDVVRGMSQRLDAHLSVAAKAVPDVEPWVTLRAAEELANGETVAVVRKDGCVNRSYSDEGDATAIIVEDEGMKMDASLLDGRQVLSWERINGGAVVRVR